MVQQTACVVLPLAVVLVTLLAPASGLGSSRTKRSQLEGEGTRDQHGNGHDHPSEQPPHHNTQHAQNQHTHNDGDDSLKSSADGVVNQWLYRFPPWSESNPAPQGFKGKSTTKTAPAHATDGSHRTGRLQSVKVPGNIPFQTEVVKTILDRERSVPKQSTEPALFTPSPSSGQNTFTPIRDFLQPPAHNFGITTALNSNKNNNHQNSNHNAFVSPPSLFDTVPSRFPVVDGDSTVFIVPEMESFIPEDVFLPSNPPQNFQGNFNKLPFISQLEFNRGTGFVSGNGHSNNNRQPKQVISVTKSLGKSSDFRPSPLLSISQPSDTSAQVESFDYKISVTPYPLPDVPTHTPLPLYPHITKEILNSPSNNVNTPSHSQISHENNINVNLVQNQKRKKPPVTYHPKGSADTLWVPFVPGIPLPILLQQAHHFSRPAGTRQARFNSNKRVVQNNSHISRNSDDTGRYPTSIQDIIDSEFGTAESLFRRGPQSSQQKISVTSNQNNNDRWVWAR